MNLPLRRKIEEASEFCGVSCELILHFIEEDWIRPIDLEEKYFDEEDLARIELIRELQEDFGINEEGISIVLHLIDQLNYYKSIIQTGRNLR